MPAPSRSKKPSSGWPLLSDASLMSKRSWSSFALMTGWIYAKWGTLPNAPELIPCADCGELTETHGDYARISYLKTRKWRCPGCYHQWKSSDTRTRGQRFTCQVPRCTTGWLSPEQACEVIDPITEAVYIMCPSCHGRWGPARDRERGRIEAVKESAYKEGFRNGSMQKPISVTVPMNPDAVRNIAATVALIAPDFTTEECTSLAQSFFDMVVPVAVAAMDPGDAGPKAPDGAWGVKSEMVARMQRRLRDAEESGDCAAFVNYLALMEHDSPGLREQYQQTFGDAGDATRDKLRALIYGEPGRLKGALRGASVSYLDVDEVQDQP